MTTKFNINDTVKLLNVNRFYENQIGDITDIYIDRKNNITYQVLLLNPDARGNLDSVRLSENQLQLV